MLVAVGVADVETAAAGGGGAAVAVVGFGVVFGEVVDVVVKDHANYYSQMGHH